MNKINPFNETALTVFKSIPHYPSHITTVGLTRKTGLSRSVVVSALTVGTYIYPIAGEDIRKKNRFIEVFCRVD